MDPSLLFSGIGGGLGVFSSLGQGLFGNKQIKEAKQALNDFEFQELENVFKDMPISTVGSDIMREEASRTTAGMVDAARSGGVRGVLSALPRIQQYSNDVNNDIAMDMDNQIRERNRLIAEDKARIRSMQEQRDRDELAGLGQQLAVGQQNFMSGLNSLSSPLFSAGSLLKDYEPKAGGV